VSITGAIDASYDWRSTDASSTTLRFFDVGKNTFSLHQVNLTVAKQPAEGFGGVINVVAGDDANIIGGGSDDFDLTQAYAQYATGALTVMGGRFVTLAGAEVINPALNTNASRSLLFFYQPLVHTGVRAAYKFGDPFTLTAGLSNGQTAAKTDNNSFKTVELQAAVTPFKALTVYLTGYSGNEQPPGAPNTRVDTLDLVANLTVSDMLSFGLNGDYFNVSVTDDTLPGSVETKGIAGYGNVKFSDKLRLSARVEYISSGDDFVDESEGTLTLAWSPAANFDLLTEVRGDRASEDIFTKDSAPSGSQTSATVKGIFKF
jgi:hypothetical protein